MDETFALIDHNRNRAGELKLPLLMILSKQDSVVDWQAARQFFDEAASNQKELMFVDEARHAIPVDFGWEKAAERIMQLVEVASPRKADATARETE